MKKITAALLMIGMYLAAALAIPGCGYNSSVDADQSVKAAWADVEAAYQRRMNLIPNLVKTVQASANFEKSVLTEVTEARASATAIKLTADDLTDPAKVKAFQAAQTQLSSSLGRLLAVSENYPTLKSTQAFSDLMVELEGCENRINTEVHKYNDRVAVYNNVVLQFPTSIGSSMRGFRERPTFKADDGAEKAPQVDFGSGK